MPPFNFELEKIMNEMTRLMMIETPQGTRPATKAEVTKHLFDDNPLTKQYLTDAEITHGSIAGQGDGNWGKVTVLTNGSILLENVSLANIQITNCNIVAESGERPIPFSSRMNSLCDYVEFSKEHPDATLYAGHTHNFTDPYSDEGVCICGKKKPEENQ
jgi:hypothetical protein